jgi:hypothetical protein
MSEGSRNLSGRILHRSSFKDGWGAVVRRRVPD